MAFGSTSSFSRSFRAGERPISITSASQLPNLEVWYYADVNTTVGGLTSGSEVSAWSNAGGLTSHDWNSTGGARPEWFSNIQNSKGVVRFNNTGATPTGEDADNNERLTINPVAYLQNLSGSTMVILFRSLSTAAGIRYITSTDAGGFQFGQNGTQWIGGFSGATFSINNITADTNFHHVIINFDGTKAINTDRLKIRLDGFDNNITISGSVNTATSSVAGYFFGGCTGTNSANVSNFFIGDIGEIMIFTRSLSLGEELAIEQYLTNKWAV